MVEIEHSAETTREALLVLRAQLGDCRALDDLLAASQDRLYRFLVRLVVDPHLAEDLLQDVFVQICRSLRWLQHPQFFRTWTYRITARAAFRRLHRVRRDRMTSLDESSAPIAAPALAEPLDRESIDQLREKISLLSPNTRAVIVLHYYEGLSLSGVAAVLDLPVGTVKSRLGLGLAALRRIMREET